MQTQFTPKDVARFWAAVDKDARGGCWLWCGQKNQLGYGRFFAAGKLHSAHRVAWQLTNGVIPDGQLVCHNCPGGDNPSCVNPAHLWLGTDQENVTDMVRKGRQRFLKGEESHLAKLTTADVLTIRQMFERRRTTKQKN